MGNEPEPDAIWREFRIGEFTILRRNGRPMTVLGWSDGKRAIDAAADFASVIRRLPGERLAYWHRRMRCMAEKSMLSAELERRRISDREGDQDGQLLLF
jgi:hypothetical protein